MQAKGSSNADATQRHDHGFYSSNDDYEKMSNMNNCYQLGKLPVSNDALDVFKETPDSITSRSMSIPSKSNKPVADVEAEADAYTAEEWKPSKNELLIMISLSFISLIVAIDSTVLVTALPEIAHKLNGTTSEAFWAGTSYLLTSAVFQPVIASISCQFGRQPLLLMSLTLFTVGTILCSVAENITTLLVGRSIQGIGGGGMIALTQVIFCDIVPLRQRPKYFAMVLGSWSCGSIIGPVIGGVLIDRASWRWCFHINYPFCAIGIVVALFLIRMKAVTALSLSEKLKRTDWLGAVIFIGSMTSFIYGISSGGIQHPWKSAATLGPIFAGFVGFIVFVCWQWYKKEHTLLPISIFNTWSIYAAFFCALANGLVLFALLYYFPFYQMSVRKALPTKAGIWLFPTMFLLIPGSIIVSVLTTRLGRFRWAIWGGWVITTITCGTMILYDLNTRPVVMIVINAIFGIGSGMVLTSVNLGIQAMSKPEDSPMAASMYGFFRSLGMPLGVGIAGTVFQNSMSSKLSELGLPTTIAHESEHYVFVLRTMADSAQKTAILASYVKGFQSVFVLTTAISAAGLVASFAIRKSSMDKALHAQYTAR